MPNGVRERLPCIDANGVALATNDRVSFMYRGEEWLEGNIISFGESTRNSAYETYAVILPDRGGPSYARWGDRVKRLKAAKIPRGHYAKLMKDRLAGIDDPSANEGLRKQIEDAVGKGYKLSKQEKVLLSVLTNPSVKG